MTEKEEKQQKERRVRRVKRIRRDKVELKSEKTILWISFGTGVAFAAAEFISAMVTHSQSVLMDAAYDSTELIVIILTLFLTPLFHKPVSEKRPYGFMQVESIFIIIKSFMLLSVSLGLVGNSLNLALSGGRAVNGLHIALFQLAAGTASLVVYFIMAHLNKSASSPTVRAELLGWKLDVGYSLGMALAFFCSMFLDRTPLAFLSPYFDQVVAVLIVISMLPENFQMLWQAMQDVFLFSPEESLVEEIKAISEPVLNEFEFEPVFYDITRTGRKLWVSVYFKIEEDQISIKRLRDASSQIQKALDEKLENCVSELILAPDEECTPLQSA